MHSSPPLLRPAGLPRPALPRLCRRAGPCRRGGWILATLIWVLVVHASAAEVFRVATFNVENYLSAPAGTRPAKSAESKAQVRESIRAMNADVIAFQEMGGIDALLELRASLKAEGFEYPHWEHVSGFDTNIHVAVLSRLPIVARRSHTNEAFLLRGRRFRTSRGIAEIDIQVNPRYQFTLFAVHLKSRRPVSFADEADLREQEAGILREKIDARLAAQPRANILVVGDLNDVQDARSTRLITARGQRGALVDTRPSEWFGDSTPPTASKRTVSWTYFYAKEDTYSRIDYILASAAMAREWIPQQSYVLALPKWGLASDHRPVLAAFLSSDQ